MNDFEKMNWHDNHIHSFKIREGEDGWSGVLEFDIDYIIEWHKEKNSFNFLLAPATLTFYGVSDLVISIDYVKASVCVQPMMIYDIRREIKTFPNGYSAFDWIIEMGWPTKSFISFSASDFNQQLWGEPITSSSQYLSHSERQDALPK